MTTADEILRELVACKRRMDYLATLDLPGLAEIHDANMALEIAWDAARAHLKPEGAGVRGNVKPDTERQVFFYEQDFYVLSNFSAFNVTFRDVCFDTSEHAYHYQRFTDQRHRNAILATKSAHEAFRHAQDNKAAQRPEWDSVKVDTMREILRAKVEQHEYVRRKLLQTGDRELIEDSWRDDFWGWGPNRDGQNMLGKMWMEIRDCLPDDALALRLKGR